MKKWMTLTCVLLLLVNLLSACGGKESASATVDVDLDEFFEQVEETYAWGDDYMADIEGELLDSYYPGLSDIAAEQLIAKVPTMSSVVNELVFMECETEEGASAAAAILQDRVKMQAEGGAWYAESMEAWSNAIVIQQGTYVCMVASAEHQDEISQSFNDLFL